jgi:hypothetical protein
MSHAKAERPQAQDAGFGTRVLVGKIESAHHPVAFLLGRKAGKYFMEFEDAK